MNFILTTLWLTFMTCVGFFVGEFFPPDYIVVSSIVFFVIALVIRFAPQILGEIFEFIFECIGGIFRIFT